LQQALGLEPKGLAVGIEPFDYSREIGGGSTDVADVSWIVPSTGELHVATRPLGIPNHQWGTVSSAGSSIGIKGMRTVAKVLAASGVEILLRPDIREQARAEFREKTKDSPYRNALPPGQKPPTKPK
jgi:aminobenzoyl-glutamate utilization protein B